MAKSHKHTEQWGKDTAKARYGGQSNTGLTPADKGQNEPQAPEDKHGPGYDNDVPLSGWLRGPDATKKPGFLKPSFKR